MAASILSLTEALTRRLDDSDPGARSAVRVLQDTVIETCGYQWWRRREEASLDDRYVVQESS